MAASLGDRHGGAGDSRRYRREARTALPSSLKNPWLSPTRRQGHACCLSRGQLQALQSAMSASEIGATRVPPPQEEVLVAPTANLHVGGAAVQPMNERHPFDMGNLGLTQSGMVLNPQTGTPSLNLVG